MSVYFTRASFQFLRDLRNNNNRAWFADNKSRYEGVVRQPFLHLIADLQPALAKISTHYVADPRTQGGSMFRIHRDTRYANDKTPYKTWAGARLFHEHHRQQEAPSFYMHFEPADCFVGGGIWHPGAEALKRIRSFPCQQPGGLEKATRSRSFTTHFALGGDSLIRDPRGFEVDADLLQDIKRKDFVASQRFADALACSNELKPLLIDRFKRVAPMIDYLCASLDLDF
ncbi:MAG: DUF2461 domain-containing protein [Dokdonella sp.]|uniref:DUF2461 domain-containing protein n=1 Tax=Dokdonella sp. TaxID=2291710 RepID=UPI0025C5E6DE|nr:DUF2461 domain-containing protein [Dokdonella sp.]MBK8122263.1 DUF2461 domain-containing protein [Dokdonella sp.]